MPLAFGDTARFRGGPMRNLIIIILISLLSVGASFARSRNEQEAKGIKYYNLHEMVDKTISLQGTFSLNGVVGPYILVDEHPVYLVSKGSFTWGKSYSKMEGKQVIVTGVLLFGSLPESEEQHPSDYYYFEAEKAKILPMLEDPDMAKASEYHPSGYQKDGLLHITHQMYSGMESPGWSVRTSQEVEHLKTFLSGLTHLGKPVPLSGGPPSMPQGCEFDSYIVSKIRPDPNFPDYIEVCKGVVLIDKEHMQRTFRDDKELEKFLTQEALTKEVK